MSSKGIGCVIALLLGTVALLAALRSPCKYWTGIPLSILPPSWLARDLANSPDVEVRRRAAAQLSLHPGVAQEARALASSAEGDPDEVVRVNAIAALHQAYRGNPDRSQFLALLSRIARSDRSEMVVKTAQVLLFSDGPHTGRRDARSRRPATDPVR